MIGTVGSPGEMGFPRSYPADALHSTPREPVKRTWAEMQMISKLIKLVRYQHPGVGTGLWWWWVGEMNGGREVRGGM